MTKQRIITALYLLGIFVFPLIFQPWHIIQHHGDDYECSVHIHKIDQSYGHAHHHDSGCSHEKMLPLISLQNPDHSHDPCYICDYKFPIKDLPAPFQPGFIVLKFQGLHSVNLVISDLQRAYSLINPRAPPCSNQGLS
jgi:hypothetical protein